MGELFPPPKLNMRRRLPSISKGVITKALTNQILRDEVFDVFKRQIVKAPATKFEKSTFPRKNSKLRDFQALIEEEYPLAEAARLSKKEIKQITAGLTRGERRRVRRYFRRARVVLNGGDWKPRKKAKKHLRYNYTEYIQSPEWRSRRNRFFQRFGRTCAACDSPQKIHLHHMVYSAFNGTEPDAHLVALCETHHNDYHEKYGTSRSMLKTTKAFIDEIRSSEQTR